MRTKMIEEYIGQLSVALGGVRPLIAPEKLREMHKKKNFVSMVHYIRTTLKLDLRIRVNFVNSDGPTQVPACINMPATMPPYGTSAFRKTTITIYIQKTFLKQRPFETIVSAIAHELSHVVIEAIGHKLENQEEAVDLTAMVLGYRNFFRIGCHYEEDIESVQKRRHLCKTIYALPNLIFGKKMITRTHTFGYLTIDEINFAADIMDCQASQIM